MLVDPKKFLDTFAGATDRVVVESSANPTLIGDELDLLGHVNDHLNGKAKVGIFVLREDSTVNWAIVQFDWRAIAGPGSAASTYQKALATYGIPSYLQSTSDVQSVEEYQVWIFFDTPLQVDRVVRTIRGLISQSRLEEHIPSVPGGLELMTGESQYVFLPYFGESTSSSLVDQDGNLFTDANVFVDNVKRASVSEFESLERAISPLVHSMQDDRANHMGTPAGFQKVKDNCPFVKWCEDNATIGISEPLMTALITNLCRFGKESFAFLVEIAKKGPENFNIVEYKDRVASMIGEHAPTSYAAIKGLGWPGIVPKWPNSPAGWGIYLDLDRLMEAFKGLDKAELQLELDNHFEHDFARLSFEEQNDWITRLASDLGLKASDLRKAAAKALLKSDFPGWSLAEVFTVAEMDDVTPEATGKMMFGWFRGNKGVAYKDENDRLLIAWKGKHIVVGRNQAFTDFLYSEGEVTFETPRVKRIVEAFKAESSLNSESAGKVAWVRSSRAAGTLYLHLNNSDGKIFKFDVNGVTTLDNGYNDERVFLKASPKVNQWSFTAVSIKEYREAIKLFDERILQLFACSDEDRLLYACWVLAYPFLEYVESRPHLRCEGPSSKGKSRAMDVVSRLVYGENRLKNPTEASNYNDAAQNPLLLIDNIETAQLTKELAQFILTAVSGVEREKMSADSSTGMVSLRARCIINTSGIDNLNRPELINRTIHIVFDVDKYGKKVWSQTFINLIGRDRDRLLSTHVHIIGNVVRRIANGGLKQWRDALQAKYPRHVLGRSLEYICIMALIADELVPVVMPKAKSDEVVDKWMIGQESYVGNIARESNPIVVAIETIFDDARKWRAIASPPKWPYELLCDGETLVGGSAQLVAMLTAAAKRASIHFPYNMPNLLSRRLKDAQGVLDDAGFVLLVGRDKNRKHDIFTISRKREASTKVTQIPKKKATGQKSKSEKNAN